MKVIAAQGLKCPCEKKPREYITDAVEVDVPETAYYLRLIGDGSLMLAGKKATKKEARDGQ